MKKKRSYLDPEGFLKAVDYEQAERSHQRSEDADDHRVQLCLSGEYRGFAQDLDILRENDVLRNEYLWGLALHSLEHGESELSLGTDQVLKLKQVARRLHW